MDMDIGILRCSNNNYQRRWMEVNIQRKTGRNLSRTYNKGKSSGKCDILRNNTQTVYIIYLGTL